MEPDALVGVVQPIDVHNEESILQEAERIVAGNRQFDYGPPEDNFQRISLLWIAYMIGKYPQLAELMNESDALNPEDVAMMMVLLKVARTMENTKRDNYVDGAGYLSIAARLAGVTE